jgi:hypothetical protein
MEKKATVLPPHPELLRQPAGRFGWLEDRLLHDGWLAHIGPEATSVLVLLALAADRQGSSFYGRGRMAEVLGMSRHEVDQALLQLLKLRLVAHRPWRPGHPDGIWQLLPVPPSAPPPPALPHRGGEPASIGEVIRSFIQPLPPGTTL